MELDRTDTPTAAEYGTVYVAFELSKAKWKLGVMVPGSAKMSRYTIAGGDLAALAARFAVARAKAARTGKPVRIVSCYEAGFDGHWLHPIDRRRKRRYRELRVPFFVYERVVNRLSKKS